MWLHSKSKFEAAGAAGAGGEEEEEEDDDEDEDEDEMEDEDEVFNAGAKRSSVFSSAEAFLATDPARRLGGGAIFISLAARLVLVS